jgi:hypothetical protein
MYFVLSRPHAFIYTSTYNEIEYEAMNIEGIAHA